MDRKFEIFFSKTVLGVFMSCFALITSVAFAQDGGEVRVRGLTQAESLERLLAVNAELREENAELKEKLRETEIRNEAYVRRIRALNDALSEVREEQERSAEELAEIEEEYERRLTAQIRRRQELRQRVDELEKHLEEETYKQQWEEAVRKLETAQRVVGELSSERESLLTRTAKMHYNLGLLFFKEGDHKRAAAEFKLALQQLPNDADIYYNLAVIKDYYLEDPEKAAQYYRKYLEYSSDPQRELEVRERITDNELRARIRAHGR